MKTDLELIENYLTGQLPSDERAQFEASLRTDPEVANALAFYLMSKQVAKDEAREQRRAELDALRTKTVRPLWSAPMRWAAAASVFALLGLGWYFFQPTDSLADEYIAQHFIQLPLTMDGASSGSGTVDSLKNAVGLFNDGKLDQAEAIFQDVLTRQTSIDSVDMANVLKNAGIVSLRQGNYDKAITLFHRLSQQPDLVANPGMFYEALAHLKRGQPLDKSLAKKLLEEVVTRNLEEKGEAKKFLEQIK